WLVFRRIAHPDSKHPFLPRALLHHIIHIQPLPHNRRIQPPLKFPEPFVHTCRLKVPTNVVRNVHVGRLATAALGHFPLVGVVLVRHLLRMTGRYTVGNAGGVDHWAGTPASTGLRSRHPAMYWDRLRWWLAVVLGMSCHSE